MRKSCHKILTSTKLLTTILLLFLCGAPGVSPADEPATPPLVERSWIFDSIRELDIYASDIRMSIDDVPAVTLLYRSTSYIPEKDSPTVKLTGNRLCISIRWGDLERWSIKVPRQLKLDLITGSCERTFHLTHIRASHLRMHTFSQYLLMDSCEIDSLWFRSDEGTVDMTSSVISDWAEINCGEPVHLGLLRLPSELLNCGSWSVTISVRDIGESYQFEIPILKDATVKMPLECTKSIRRLLDTLTLNSALWCIARKGNGKPMITCGPYLHYFELTVGADSQWQR